MPPTGLAAKRYAIIDACIRNPVHRYPSLKDICVKINAGLKLISVSKETVQKDIALMKKPEDEGGFSAPIKFKKSHNGYYYENEFVFRSGGLNESELKAIELAAGVLKQYKGFGVSGSFSNAIDKLLSSINIEKNDNLVNAIQPEDTVYVRGMEYFDILAESINKKKPVSFIYYNFNKKEFKCYVVHAYMLKESGKRWYLVGYSEDPHIPYDPQAIRYFGLERMYSPVLLDKTYMESQSADLLQLFENSIGIRPLKPHHQEQSEEVILWVSSIMAPFIKSAPLHKSQKTETNRNGELLVTLKLVPKVELISLILFYGKEMEVLQPVWLRKKIEQDLKSSIQRYNSKNAKRTDK